MLLEMREFLLDDRLAVGAEKAYSEMFGHPDDFSRTYREMRDIALGWEAPRHLKRKDVVFSIMVPTETDKRMPLSDVSKIKIDNIGKIPSYIRSHHYADTFDEIDESDYRSFTLPLTLTTTDDLLSSWAYVLDETGYSEGLLASIMFEMSILGEDLTSADERKNSIADEIEESCRVEGKKLSCDEIMMALKPEPRAEKPENPDLEEMLVSRYNARLGMYERLHFDLVSLTE